MICFDEYKHRPSKATVKFSIQHVPKSTASTELAETTIWRFPDYLIRCVAFYDIPLKGNYTVGIFIDVALFQGRYLSYRGYTVRAYPLKTMVISRLVQLDNLSI